MWWGYSSALDLLDECDLSKNSVSSNDGTSAAGDSNEVTLNMLLVGQSDNRHVLKTLAKKYCHSEKINLNIYICESLLENIARDLLFLVLALEPNDRIGLADKTKFFVELYGNTLIRPATSNYLANAAQQLLMMVTDSNYAHEIMPRVSLDNLKYKERDQLEVIFKYWATNNAAFDILTFWDQRNRKSLGVRYDARHGVFDWDYHMRYRSFGAEMLNIQEYKRFRELGMSFHFEDTDPCVANRTLASSIISAGSKIINYGYLGDIVTGPYPAFGFACEDQRMLEKVNGHPKKTATDLTEHNVMRLFHEIENNEPFHEEIFNDQSTAFMMADSSDRLRIKTLPQNAQTTDRKIQVKPYTHQLISIENCNIYFLPTKALKDCLNKTKYENFFDLITFPQVMVLKHFTPDLVKLLKPNCIIIVDTPKYLLSYREEDLQQYKKEVEDLMKQCNCETLNSSFSYKTDEFMRFLVVK